MGRGTPPSPPPSRAGFGDSGGSREGRIIDTNSCNVEKYVVQPGSRTFQVDDIAYSDNFTDMVARLNVFEISVALAAGARLKQLSTFRIIFFLQPASSLKGTFSSEMYPSHHLHCWDGRATKTRVSLYTVWAFSQHRPVRPVRLLNCLSVCLSAAVSSCSVTDRELWHSVQCSVPCRQPCPAQSSPPKPSLSG